MALHSALVLAAGLGTRLDPLTRIRAKPAMPLGDSTLVEHVLAWLSRQGVHDVVLNLHHRPATVAAVVGDGSHLGVRARYSWEPLLLGSAGGPRHALPLIESDPFLIVNGDTLCELPVAPLLAAHRRLGASVTMAVVPNPAPDRYGGLSVGADDEVQGFVPRGRAHGTWHFVGVQVVDRRVFAGLADNEPIETVAGIYRTMVSDEPGRIRVHRVETPVYDIGTAADYLETARALGDTAADALARRTSVPATARVRDSVIWPGVVVGADADLERTVVAGAVAIPDGFRARGKVIVPAAVARAGDPADIQGALALFPLDR